MASKTYPLTKLYYKIGEVSKIVGVKPYVLRYWESEFGLRLEKSPSRQRVYQKKDIETFMKIKTLLYEERYTIAGAKQKLRAQRSAEKAEGLGDGVDVQHIEVAYRDALQNLRHEIEQLKDEVSQI